LVAPLHVQTVSFVCAHKAQIPSCSRLSTLLSECLKSIKDFFVAGMVARILFLMKPSHFASLLQDECAAQLQAIALGISLFEAVAESVLVGAETLDSQSRLQSSLALQRIINFAGLINVQLSSEVEFLGKRFCHNRRAGAHCNNLNIHSLKFWFQGVQLGSRLPAQNSSKVAQKYE